MDNKRVEMAEAYAGAIRGFYSSWLVFFAAVWAVSGLLLIFRFEAPLGQFLGLPALSAEALLVDIMVIITLPIAGVVWHRIGKVNAKARAQREAFLAETAGLPLLTFVYDPQRVFHVVGEDAEAGTVEVVPLWNANGIVLGGAPSMAERTAFRDFDADAFLGSG